jgi:hypothetical protein
VTTTGGVGVGGVGVGVGASPPLLHPAKDSNKKLSTIILFLFIFDFSFFIIYNLTILN